MEVETESLIYLDLSPDLVWWLNMNLTLSSLRLVALSASIILLSAVLCSALLCSALTSLPSPQPLTHPSAISNVDTFLSPT